MGTGLKIIVKSSKGQSNITKTKLVFANSVRLGMRRIENAHPRWVFDAKAAAAMETR